MRFERPRLKTLTEIACSRRSDSKAGEKNSRRNKKTRGRLEGERERELSPPFVPSPPPRFPSVQFNSLPTDHRALLSERPEQAVTDTLIIPDITKTESKSCFIIHYFEENKDKQSIA